MKEFEAKYHDYLQTQIGNPEGPDKPNKKYYDPREALRAGENEQAAEALLCCLLQTTRHYHHLPITTQPLTTHRSPLTTDHSPLTTTYSLHAPCYVLEYLLQVARLTQCFGDLNCVNVCGLNPVAEPANVLGPRRGGLPC